jgi:hypothetical protein
MDKCNKDILGLNYDLNYEIANLHESVMIVEKRLDAIMQIADKYQPSCIDHIEDYIHNIKDMEISLSERIKKDYKKRMLEKVNEI